MKRITSVVVLFLMASVFAWAETQSKDIKNALKRETLKAVTNSGIIRENNTFEFGVLDEFSDINSQHYYQIGCKAYALHPNWVLIAGTCAYPMDTYYDYYGRWFTPTTHTVYSYTNDEHLFYNERVMLVKLDTAQPHSHYLKVLATSSPSTLFAFSATHEIKISTSRFALFLDKVRERKLKGNSVKTKQDKQIFQLQDELLSLSGTSTDPLFLIARNGNEFLAAYNNGVMDYISRPYGGLDPWFGRTSDDWYTLTLEDLQFIKDTVQHERPADWSFIRTRLFFDDTTTPYFAK